MLDKRNKRYGPITIGPFLTREMLIPKELNENLYLLPKEYIFLIRLSRGEGHYAQILIVDEAYRLRTVHQDRKFGWGFRDGVTVKQLGNCLQNFNNTRLASNSIEELFEKLNLLVPQFTHPDEIINLISDLQIFENYEEPHSI